MKWGRKKASSASSHHSFITRVFSSSWFLKFKQKKGSFETKSAKEKQKVQQDLPCSLSCVSLKEGRFYCGDDDPYWRLSFGEEGAERSKVWLNSAWDDPNDDEHGVAIPILESSTAVWKFNDMVPDIRKAREMPDKVGSPLENNASRREKVSKGEERKSAWRKTVKDKKSRKLNQKTFEEKQDRAANPAEKAIFEVQPEKIIHTREDFSRSRVSDSRKRQSFSFPNSSRRTIKGDCILKTLNLETSNAFSKQEEKEEEEAEINLQCKKLEDMKIKELTLKSVRQRRPIYTERHCPRKRRKHTSRIKCFSPRTAAKIECKIRALEDMKKAKMSKKKTKETMLRDAAIFESYAVAKSSFNPRKDFRDSMIEMIMEKGIERPEELEELLACYLTLNYDEYHDLIIKVFRQVYFELNQVYFASELQNYRCCED